MSKTETIRYLNHWSLLLKDYTQQIERHYLFWVKHVPSNITVIERSGTIFGFYDPRFYKENAFSLEMIVSASIDSQGDADKIVYNANGFVINMDATDLVTRFMTSLNYVKEELQISTPISESFIQTINTAKRLSKIGRELSTLPE